MKKGMIFLFLLVWATPAMGAPNPTPNPAPNLAKGKALYEQQCARCHGFDGKGDGIDAQRMYPKPRDFAAGTFKFRSTVSGTPPTDEDLFHTISRGLPGSRMPSFAQLSEDMRRQLIAYVKEFSPIFKDAKPEPVALTPDPGAKAVDLAKGKKAYGDLGCAQCHGPSGRGNGPSAPTLVDNWGAPIRPADLTHGFSYRAGSDPKSITLRVLTGIDGTPMPSYADAAGPEDIWQLAYYVQSLQEEPNFKEKVEVSKASGALPVTLADPAWAKIPRVGIRLSGNFYHEGKIAPTMIDSAFVQAVCDGEQIALRLVWHDPTESRQPPGDSIAILLKPKSARGIVNALTWPAPESPSLDLILWSAEDHHVREVVAGNFPAAASDKSSGVELKSETSFNDGAWTLLIVRPLQSNTQGAAAFSKSEPVPLALAAWDGGNQEAGRRRSASTWVGLVLK